MVASLWQFVSSLAKLQKLTLALYLFTEHFICIISVILGILAPPFWWIKILNQVIIPFNQESGTSKAKGTHINLPSNTSSPFGRLFISWYPLSTNQCGYIYFIYSKNQQWNNNKEKSRKRKQFPFLTTQYSYHFYIFMFHSNFYSYT